ncbi:CvpA family protein [Marinoscillum sp. MHG1-6]|uniref:CvpA family protein n=1 Tax=Marinoscillum sp. MHG1-6 TaxID=2959627 RepID=UPI002157D4CD|nr:CvpA family protein [Marinoscillum sp. MHG1-6]
MEFLDIFFLVVFLFGLIKGYLKGLIVEVFSFIGFFVGLFVAIELTIPVSNHFMGDGQFAQLVSVGVFVMLFILVLLIMNLGAKILKKAIDVTFLGLFDNILGALAGMFKLAFILSVFIWVFDSLGIRLSSEMAGDSFLYPLVEMIGPTVFTWVSEIIPLIKDMMDSLENFGGNSESVYTFL